MGFEYPPGDPGPINAAATSLTTVGNDLKTQESSTKNAFAHALESWKGTRADDFRSASAGIQFSVQQSQTAVEQVVTALHGFAKAMTAARTEIDHLKGLAHTRQQHVDELGRQRGVDDPEVIKQQHLADTYVASLEEQAEDERRKVKTAAHAAAGVVGSQTNGIVPDSESLSPDQVARKVREMTGVTGVQGDINSAKLTSDEAWKALSGVEKSLNDDDVEDDGSINWEKVNEELEKAAKSNEKVQDWWALGVAPPAGWALLKGAPAVRQSILADKLLDSSLRALLPEWERPNVNLDAGGAPGSLDDVMGDIEKSFGWNAADDQAVNALIESQNAGGKANAAIETLARNGLPKSFELLGDGVGVLGYLGDAYTLFNPKSAPDDRIAAGLNATGLGMLKTGKPIYDALKNLANNLGPDVDPAPISEAADGAELTEGGSTAAELTEGGSTAAELTEGGATAAELAEGGGELAGLAAADASVGWVPVVGWALVAGTAGYEIYKHWDSIKSGASSAVHEVSHLASGAGHLISKIPHPHIF